MTADTTGDARSFQNVATIQDFWATQAMRKILNDHGDKVYITSGDLLKFGRTLNADSGVKTTVMYLEGTERHETLVDDNSIDTISSSDGTDDQIITIVGHTITAGNKVEITQNATLNGQTKVVLTTPLSRVNRAYNNDTTVFAGSLYIYEDGAITAGVPNTDNEVHMTVLAAEQQSEKAATATDYNEYLIITRMVMSVNRATSSASNVDIELEIQRPNNVFRPVIAPITLRTASTTSIQVDLGPYIIVPKNSDVRVVATSSANDTVVTAGFFGIHARVYT